MARRVDCLRPVPPRGVVLIQHGPSHLHEGPVLPFYNAILLRNIWGRKLMLKTQRGAEMFKVRILELSPIVSA